MPALISTGDFSSHITSDLTWRIREISDIRSAVGAIDESLRKAVLRAGVPLIYAHWEGHVVFVARAYLDFLATRRPRYRRLKPSFRLNEFFRAIRQMTQTRLNHADQISFLIKIIESGELQFRRVNEDTISSRSNLNFQVLNDLCSLLSIDVEQFAEDAEFIDKILLYRRNNIAHGQFVDVSSDMFRDMSDRVIGMMRKFNNLVDNDVNLARYQA